MYPRSHLEYTQGSYNNNIQNNNNVNWKTGHWFWQAGNGRVWLNSPQMAIISNITNLNQPVSGRGISSLGCIFHAQLNLHSKLAHLFCCISILPGEPVRQNNGRHLLSLQQQRPQPAVQNLAIALQLDIKDLGRRGRKNWSVQFYQLHTSLFLFFTFWDKVSLCFRFP